MTMDLHNHRAFTLVELLAAMAVFVLMAGFVLALTNATNRSVQVSTRAVDASSQARLALDRIGADLANALQRQDAVFCPTNNNGNLLQFLSQVESANEPAWPTGTPSVNRGTSVVAYQVAASAANLNRLCLVRGATPFQWTDTGYMGLGVADGYPIPLPTPASTDYDVLAPGVIAMVVAFQLYPDNSTVNLAGQDGANPTSASSQGQIVYSPPLRMDVGTNQYVDLSHVSAVVVGVAALDLQSLQMLNAAQVLSLSEAFTNTSVTNQFTTNVTPSQIWEPIAANVAALPASVPLPARQSVRVFQRFYPVTPFARN